MQLPLGVVIPDDEIITMTYDKLNSGETSVKHFKKDIKTIFNAINDSIKECLLSGNKVRVANFMTIDLITPKPSQVRHPVSGKMIFKGKYKLIKILPLGKFKEQLEIERE